MRWVFAEDRTNTQAAKELMQELNLPAFVAAAFMNRGADTPERAREIFATDTLALNPPSLFEHMDAAVNRIEKAVKANEKITIYGDYDVDGVTSIIILHTFFRDVLKYNRADFYIPNRHNEGYGLNLDALKQIKAGGTKLIITVDCGITAGKEVDYCAEHGVDVIVTDHHMPSEESLPKKAMAIINPKYSSTYPDRELSGVGTAYKLLCALAERFGIDIGDEFLDFVALGTIADIVPLTRENRILIRRGLKRMQNTGNAGLSALMDAAGMKKGAPITTYHVGFVIGPRINAAGRIEHANKAVELFMSNDLAAIQDIAGELNAVNDERKKLMKKTEEQAVSMIKDSFSPETHMAIVLYDPKWNAGIVGLAASKVVSKFSRPAFILTMGEDGLVHGSGRSISSVNIYEALKNSGSMLSHFGGHRLAAGITLKEEDIGAFRDAINSYLKSVYSPQDMVQDLNIDAEINCPVTVEHIKALNMLEPWGEGNTRPVFCIKGAEVADVKFLKNNTMKFYVKHGRVFHNFILFSHNEEHARDIVKGAVLDIAFNVSVNEWNGEENVSMEMKDYKISGGIK